MINLQITKDSLWDIDEAYCYTLTGSFCNYRYDSTPGFITMYLFSALNRGGVTYTSAVYIYCSNE